MRNGLLKDLTCLDPAKKAEASTVSSIQELARSLQPTLNVSLVFDEWKLYQNDTECATTDVPNQRVDHFWREVFKLKDNDGNFRYQVLRLFVKSALTLAQTNAESERSLFDQRKSFEQRKDPHETGNSDPNTCCERTCTFF